MLTGTLALVAALVALSTADAALVAPRMSALRSPRHARIGTPLLTLSEADSAKKQEIQECILDAETPEELAACMEAAEETIFTMEPRDDGWNDVRKAVADFKKERAGALNTLKSNYARDTENIRESAAYRWTKVIAGELVEVITKSGPDSLEVPKVGLPSVELPKAPAQLPNVELTPAGAVKTLAALIPEAKPEPKPPPKAESRPVPKEAAAASASSTSTAINALLLAGLISIPAATFYTAFGGSLDLGGVSDVADAAASIADAAAQ